jgi:hypothetical protein
MAKVLALLPLLGWFYISLILFIGISLFLPKIWKKMKYAVFGGILIVSTVLFFQQSIDVYKETAFAWKSVFLTNEQKIALQAGDYYKQYHQEIIRAIPANTQRIALYSVPVREYHYARMYLYPFAVENHSEVKDMGAVYLLDTKDYLLRQKTLNLVGRTSDRYLVTLKQEDTE